MHKEKLSHFGCARLYRYTNHFNHIELLSKACYCKANSQSMKNKKGKIARKYWSFYSRRFHTASVHQHCSSQNMQRISNIAASNLFVLNMLRLKGLCEKSNQTEFFLLLIFGWCFGRWSWLEAFEEEWQQQQQIGTKYFDSSHAYWISVQSTIIRL